MARSLKQQVLAARKALGKLNDQIYALAPNGETPWSECLKLASHETRQLYHATSAKIAELEYAAVANGKAYPSKFGGLTWYR